MQSTQISGSDVLQSWLLKVCCIDVMPIVQRDGSLATPVPVTDVIQSVAGDPKQNDPSKDCLKFVVPRHAVSNWRSQTERSQ